MNKEARSIKRRISTAPGRLARAALAVIALGAVSGAIAEPALAGTYTIRDCPAAGGSTDAGPLSAFGGSQGAKGSCGGGEGDWVGPRGSSMAPGTVDGVQVVAPGDEALRGAKVWWYVPRSTAGATTYALAGVNSGGIAESWTPLEQRGTPSEFSLPSGTTFLNLMDYCSNDDAGQGCSFGSSGAANLQVFGAQLTVEENEPPSGSATGGGLMAHETLSGEQAISFTAGDADSGVRKVQLLIDGAVVGQEDFGANCSYTNFAACPGSESGAISWNTAAVADGRHSLELDAVDAANNLSVLYAADIQTNNTPPEQPPIGTTSESRSSAPASAGTSGPELNASPLPPASTIGAQVPSPSPAVVQLDGPSAVTRPFSRRAFTLTGHVLGADGQSLAGAVLDILSQPLGGSLRLLQRVITGSDGGFAAAIPPGPSRLLEVGYRASSEAPTYSAVARVRESVQAGVKLKIEPRRTSPEGLIELSGHVEGPVPRHGVIVDLLVHYHGRWVPFRTPRTDAAGHFESAYQFEGSVGSFPFRAEVKSDQAGFAFGRGMSSVVRVLAG